MQTLKKVLSFTNNNQSEHIRTLLSNLHNFEQVTATADEKEFLSLLTSNEYDLIYIDQSLLQNHKENIEIPQKMLCNTPLMISVNDFWDSVRENNNKDTHSALVSILDCFPNPVIELDFSKVKRMLISSNLNNPLTLKEYFQQNPAFLFEMAQIIELKFANKKSLSNMNLNSIAQVNKEELFIRSNLISVLTEITMFILSNQKTAIFNTAYKDPSGAIIYYQSSFIVPDENIAQMDSVFILSVDTSEIETSNSRLRHLNSQLTALRSINRLITREKNINSLIENTTRILYENKFHKSVSIVINRQDKILYSENGISFPLLLNFLKKIAQQRGKTVIENNRFYDADILSGCKIPPNCVVYIYEIKYEEQKFGYLSTVEERELLYEEDRSFFHELVDDIGFALYSLESGQTLKTTEDRLEMALLAASINWWEWDLVSNGLSFSSHNPNLNGWTEEQVSGRIEKFFHLIHPDDMPILNQKVAEMLKSTESQELEYRIRTSNSEWRWQRSIGKVTQTGEKGIPIRATGVTFDITDQKMIEEKLKKSESIHRIVTENTPDIIMRFDKKHRHLFVNKAVKELPGNFAQDDFINKTHLEMGFPREKCVFWEKQIQTVFDTGKPLEVEFNFKTEDDPEFIEWRLFPEFNEKSEVESVLTISRSITKKKKDELEMKKLSSVVEHSPEVIVITNPEGIIEYVNPKFTDITGYTAEEIKGKTPSFLQDNKSDKDIAKSIWKQISSGKEWKGNFIDTRKDGKHFWESISISPLKNDNNTIVNYIIIIEDITLQIEQNIRLRDGEEKFRTLLENIPVAIFRTDISGKILSANPAMLSWLGIERETNLNSISLLNYFDKHTKKLFTENIQNELKINNLELEIKNPNGSLWGLLSCRAVKQKDQYIIDGSIKDITDRKKTEQQLHQAQKMDALGILAGGVAHDFNNILTAILGAAEMLNRHLKNTPDLEFVEQIRSSSYRATDLIKQLLSFARQTDQSKEYLMPKLLFKEALKMLRSSIPSSISIKEDINDTGFLYGNTAQIQQILVNIVTNAYHAIKSNGEIFVKLCEIQPETELIAKYNTSKAPYICLTITDNGPGIPEDILPKIFEPFFTTKEKDKGTGLGLTVVKNTVDDHNGIISVKSVYGKGAEFTILFPVARQLNNVGQLSPVTKIESNSSARILLIDDEEPISKMFTKGLSGKGCSVVAFNNPTTAYHHFLNNRNEFDIIVTDQTMPEILGHEFALRVREEECKIPIIIYSGHNEYINEKNCKDYGVSKFLYKPLDISTLLSAINEILGELKTGI